MEIQSEKFHSAPQTQGTVHTSLTTQPLRSTPHLPHHPTSCCCSLLLKPAQFTLFKHSWEWRLSRAVVDQLGITLCGKPTLSKQLLGEELGSWPPPLS